ncbi:MAG: 2-oxoacid:acceptor oxidoreductase family protein [Opitutales bacterium]|nr:2-oxoacid:acceptor oxidoreductase family protein [Opitutales bacterium]
MIASKPKYPGIRITTNGNQLVAYYTEARITDGGIFYPITPSTEQGEMYQQSYAEGKLNVFGRQKIAIECEGEHAAQGGAIAYSVTGKRTVNFTSGQGIVYGVEQYYHAPGKLSTMVLEVGARALTKHALNVHCGHDDIYAALDTGWIMLFAKDAQQAADQALILRKVTENALTPGMNIQDGFLTTHLERTFHMHESELLREYLGSPDDIIDCPTESQKVLFGPTRRRIPKVIDLKNPALIGPVQNQEHYMNGVAARRNNFVEPILDFLQEAYDEFGKLTGRHYGFISEYNTANSDTVFVTLGSSAENIEAGIDYIRENFGEEAGVVHVNVIRPFPEAAVVRALAGKKNVIIIERTDEPMAGDNPLARDVRTALTKAIENQNGFAHEHLADITLEEMPRIFSGIYGLGSRDFRPEDTLGAWQYATGKIKRQDGKHRDDGASFFTLGIDHPYRVVSKETPSLLPEGSIAVRLHSIGGWGMITTGKNLSEIIGEIGDKVAKERGKTDANGQLEELIHISANPKYGSEKKGAPTEFFLVASPERARVNCDLRHVNVVLCCDPKAFTHIDPLDGIVDGGIFVWESNEDPDTAWQRIPPAARQTIIDKKLQVYILPGFDIAKKATSRPELQLRMQGNSFLGAFFKLSALLNDHKISEDNYRELVRAQYVKKFGRFGEAVIDSNMEVMIQGGERLQKVEYGAMDAPDRSAMRGELLLPNVDSDGDCGSLCGCSTPKPEKQEERIPMYKTETFDNEYRSGLGYNQPSSPLAAVGVMAAASGATASKYGARRETPVYYPENCTQCMACITACPDTALPTTTHELSTILETAFTNYVSNGDDRAKMIEAIPTIDSAAREIMNAVVKAKEKTPLPSIVIEEINKLDTITDRSKQQFADIAEKLPLAYNKVNAIFSNMERRSPGDGGIFSIFVSDLCKGCGECVTECGDHDALRMESDTEENNARVLSATAFLDILPETNEKYLGKYNPNAPEESRPATLRNLMMMTGAYKALASGDGACAGCGEKSVLHALASVTEAYMRPLYHDKSDRLMNKSCRLEKEGEELLKQLKATDDDAYAFLKRSVSHAIMGLGGDTDADTDKRLAEHGEISDKQTIDALVAVMRQDAFNHKYIQTIDGRADNGMSVMAMGAHTGCNTVYGSTPPNNPHPYPWMNSLFQDGATISWLMGESFILDNARTSVIPERLCDHILDGDNLTEAEYFDYTHFSDTLMTDQEIKEMPKVWCVGGDGAMGDIGYQNVSKVILQNRPNVKMLMLDTQVYSNTGGQNSDSSPMTGGFDMNQIGAASQGKLVEMKNIAESFVSGHGSPYVSQVSMADVTKLYGSILEGLEYRGTSFHLCYTTCQPEHGVGDDMATRQAVGIRDSRGLPEFVSNPDLGETYQESFSIKGNKNPNRDWMQASYAWNKEKYNLTVAHWCAKEGRFRRHIKRIKEEQAADLIKLDNLILCVEQKDVVNKRYLKSDARTYVPDYGTYILAQDPNGNPVYLSLSRQMVLFVIERRKAWRMMQSRAGQENIDYATQREIIAKLESGDIARDDVWEKGAEALQEEAGEPEAVEN